ncbi:MAG: hypothetical protein HQL26_00860 [Candidatus Omnitrophica bacterium]|nr:hypothetical protein [Candidatus Omnitrophota bacterium]
MSLDKINKIIWLIIGTVVLLGIVLIVGGMGWSFFSFNRHYPSGVEIHTEKGSHKEKSYVLKTVYEMPLITEGSDFLVVPVSLKIVSNTQESERLLYKATESSSWDSSSYTRVDYIGYNYFNGPCHNLIFINKKTGQSEKLLSSRAYIDAVFFPEKKFSAEEKIKPDFILLKIGMKDTNGDGIINNKDILAGYLVGLDGKNLTQITPSEMTMVSWRYDADSKKLFVKVLADVDGDRKFTNEDNEKILVVDTQSPAIGNELVSETVKKDIEAVIKL